MRFLLKTGAFCLAVFLGYKYITADSPGYCAAQDRYISDAEFISTTEAVYAWVIEERLQYKLRRATENPKAPDRMRRPIEGPHIPRLTPWSEFAAFYEDHQRLVAYFENNRNRPGFIQVVRDDTHTIFRWLIGYQQIQVGMDESGDGVVTHYYNVCGELVQGASSFPGDVTTSNYLEILNRYPHDKYLETLNRYSHDK